MLKKVFFGGGVGWGCTTLVKKMSGLMKNLLLFSSTFLLGDERLPPPLSLSFDIWSGDREIYKVSPHPSPSLPFPILLLLLFFFCGRGFYLICSNEEGGRRRRRSHSSS